jgi:predicted GIY-YIG superfamily endonuclease
MTYVYLIRSIAHPARRYIGRTTDLKRRLAVHDSGGSTHTEQWRPWRLITYLGFSSEHCAASFEDYLKSGSGRAFANKRLWQPSPSRRREAL